MASGTAKHPCGWKTGCGDPDGPNGPQQHAAIGLPKLHVLRLLVVCHAFGFRVSECKLRHDHFGNWCFCTASFNLRLTP
jgi:hypothetical protein